MIRARNEPAMKRRELIKHITIHGAFLLREGRKHSIYQKGKPRKELPRHTEIVDELARKIVKTSKYRYHKGRESNMAYRAVIKKSGEWWIGWLVDLPGVNAQEKSRKALLESLKIGAEDMLNTPVEVKDEEELVKIEV
jgi:predicted RNase H-like HicB family nuclease